MPAEAAKESMKPLSAMDMGWIARKPSSAAASRVMGSAGSPDARPKLNSANMVSARTKGAVKPISAP